MYYPFQQGIRHLRKEALQPLTCLHPAATESETSNTFDHWKKYCVLIVGGPKTLVAACM